MFSESCQFPCSSKNKTGTSNFKPKGAKRARKQDKKSIDLQIC